MKMMNLIATSLFSLLLSSAAQANMGDDRIICPSIKTIHQTAPLFRNAEVYREIEGTQEVYYAQLSGIKANGHTWFVISSSIISNKKNHDKETASVAEALSAAVSHMVYPNARLLSTDSADTCLYYDDSQLNKSVSIMAVAKNDG